MKYLCSTSSDLNSLDSLLFLSFTKVTHVRRP